MNLIQRILNLGVTSATSAVENKHIRFTNAVALIICFFILINLVNAVYHGAMVDLLCVHLICMTMTFFINRSGRRRLASTWMSGVMIFFVTVYAILFPPDTFTVTYLSIVLFLNFFLFPEADKKYMFFLAGATLMGIIISLWWHSTGQTLMFIPQGESEIQRWMVLMGMPALCLTFGLYAFYTIHHVEVELNREKAKAEQLLLNILPAEVMRELTTTGKVKPARFDEVTILFSDFKEFTNIVATIPTHKLVHELNEIFSRFDDIMHEEGVEKIQTIGDGYLAACGLPRQDPEHALKCVRAAKKMIAYINDRNDNTAIKWKIRIGLHSGPVAAGVIGKKKFAYTIFGDTINTASRLEAASEEGRINISAYTYDLVKDYYHGEYRGKISAKGKGELDMYFV